jgi:hypothetical protein
MDFAGQRRSDRFGRQARANIQIGADGKILAQGDVEKRLGVSSMEAQGDVSVKNFPIGGRWDG